jgi:AcrR family transcriptional regulator
MSSRSSNGKRSGGSSSQEARERIEGAAYELFSRHGTRATGIDAVIERAGVAKATLYRHYPAKEDLVIAFLRRREALWTRDWFQRELERRGGTAAERLLAMFDLFDGWFRRADFEGCAFVNILLESEKTGPVREAAVGHLAAIRRFIAQLAEDCGVGDADGFARQWQILLKGSVISAAEGDRDAGQRAKEVAMLLLADKTRSPRQRLRK